MTVLVALTATTVGVGVLIGLLNGGSSLWAAAGFALLIANLTAAIMALAAEAWSRREEEEEDEHPWR